jgi:UDP-N-acetylglucosamine 2-epimerase (non-hydrolysing)
LTEMKVMSVVGARPNFMKVAPIIAAINEHNGNSQRLSEIGNGNGAPLVIRHLLVHTGQHYDRMMSGAFFADLQINAPDVDLNVGSGSHAVQTAEIMKRFEEVLLREKPEVLLVVGDVNSTLGCALVAAKVRYDASGTRPLIAHVEAGLRSFDRTMPEEVNRVLTDQISDLLFVTERSALRNLAREGVAAQKVHFVGNTMIDSLLNCLERADASTVLEVLGLRQKPGVHGEANSISRYALLTLHRPSNVDNREAFMNILDGLSALGGECPVIFPAHPRTQARIHEFKLDGFFEHDAGESGSGTWGPLRGGRGIRMIGPLGYLDFLCLMKHAALVVTDSGGIQEETTCVNVPCVTVRENTERPVTLESGTNVLGGTRKQSIAAAIGRQMSARNGHAQPEKWDGQAARRVVDVLLRVHRYGAAYPGYPVVPQRVDRSALRARSVSVS